MKIYFVAPAYPLRGGIVHYVAILHNLLKARGHDSKILSFTVQYPKFLFPGKTQEEASKENLPVDAEPVFSSINPLSWFATFWKIKHYQPDMVIFKYWMPFFAPGFGTVCLLTRWFTKTKILFICDNIISHESLPGETLLTRMLLRLVDFFIVQSDAVKADLLRLHKNAVYREVAHPIYDVFESQPLTPDEAREQFNLKPGIPVVLFFGFIKPYKGLHVLIDAIPQVRAELPDVQFLIAGEFYGDREAYLEQIQNLNAGDALQLHDDYIPNEQVQAFFRAADVVVLPYISATQSGIIQIAYSFDKPVITTRVGGLPEVVLDGKTGFVVPPQDSVALAKAIIRFFQENHAPNFIENVREEKKKYSWQPLIEAIETFS